jgi:hypothetical protein
MASVQFTDVQARPTEFLDLTSLTLDEFRQLVPPFEAAFQAHMSAWRLDGKPRTARQFYGVQKLPPPDARCCPSIACMKALRSSVGRLLIKLVANVRRHAIAQQLLHSPYVVRYTCCHGRCDRLPPLG